MSSRAQVDNTEQPRPCPGRCSDPECQERVAELERRFALLETTVVNWTFLTYILESLSKETEILTGHDDAYNCGAFFDDVRNQIVSFSWESNNCRDVFITHFRDSSHGSTEVVKNVIPFDIRVRTPMYDGKRYFYVPETGWENNELKTCRRFGRFDLESLTFQELASLPAEFNMFAGIFYGCFFNGFVYIADNESQLCRYNVETNTWERYGITLPVGGGDKWHLGELLTDSHNLYIIGSFGLYQIDLEGRRCINLSSVPDGLDGSRDVILVRPCPESDTFVIVANVAGNSWQLYSSKTGRWKALPDWKGPGITWSRNYLVYSRTTKTFYYHIHGKKTWECVQL